MQAEVSAPLVNSVSGDVRATIGSSLRKDNTWETVELERLMKNPNATSITQIDPATGIEKLLYP